MSDKEEKSESILGTIGGVVSDAGNLISKGVAGVSNLLGASEGTQEKIQEGVSTPFNLVGDAASYAGDKAREVVRGVGSLVRGFSDAVAGITPEQRKAYQDYVTASHKQSEIFENDVRPKQRQALIEEYENVPTKINLENLLRDVQIQNEGYKGDLIQAQANGQILKNSYYEDLNPIKIEQAQTTLAEAKLALETAKTNATLDTEFKNQKLKEAKLEYDIASRNFEMIERGQRLKEWKDGINGELMTMSPAWGKLTSEQRDQLLNSKSMMTVFETEEAIKALEKAPLDMSARQQAIKSIKELTGYDIAFDERGGAYFIDEKGKKQSVTPQMIKSYTDELGANMLKKIQAQALLEDQTPETPERIATNRFYPIAQQLAGNINPEKFFKDVNAFYFNANETDRNYAVLYECAREFFNPNTPPPRKAQLQQIVGTMLQPMNMQIFTAAETGEMVLQIGGSKAYVGKDAILDYLWDRNPVGQSITSYCYGLQQGNEALVEPVNRGNVENLVQGVNATSSTQDGSVMSEDQVVSTMNGMRTQTVKGFNYAPINNISNNLFQHIANDRAWGKDQNLAREVQEDFEKKESEAFTELNTSFLTADSSKNSPAKIAEQKWHAMKKYCEKVSDYSYKKDGETVIRGVKITPVDIWGEDIVSNFTIETLKALLSSKEAAETFADKGFNRPTVKKFLGKDLYNELEQYVAKKGSNLDKIFSDSSKVDNRFNVSTDWFGEERASLKSTETGRFYNSINGTPKEKVAEKEEHARKSYQTYLSPLF